MASQKHIFRGVVEVPTAKTEKEAVNLKQVKDIINRYNKEPVRVASTGELTGTYLDGVLTLNSDIIVVDGITLQVGDSILLKDQLDKKLNLVYTVKDLGTVGTPSSASASTTSSTITNVSVDKTIFETKTGASADKSYVFTYSTTGTTWQDESSTPITLSDYGISIVGTETDADTITVAYIASVAGVGGKLEVRDDFKEGTTILNNTFVNVMEGDTNQDTRWTLVSNGVLVTGANNFTWIKDIDVAQSTIKVAKAPITPDGVEKVFNIAHNFNLTDAYGYILKILDNAHNEVYVDNVPKVGDEKNAITLTFDEVPEVTEGFTVYILGLE